MTKDGDRPTDLDDFERVVFEASPIAILRADAEGRIVDANPRAAQMLGLPRAELRGRHFGGFTHPDQRASDLAKHQAMMARGDSRVQLETRWLRPDGQTVDVDLTVTTIRRPTGEVEFLFGMAIDITQRKAAEADRESSLSALEKAARVQSSFMATMSHEIRTPMTGVLGMTDALAHMSLDDAQREVVETLRTSGETMLTVINDILDFTRIEEGELHLRVVPTDLSRLTADLKRLFDSQANAKDLALRLEITPTVPPWVRADPNRLRQVLANLVSNAIKYTDHGEATVRLDTPREGSVRFEVTDTGRGIPEEDQDRIFEKFTQLQAQRTGSTGLGLAISRRLVEAMGGRLEVQSQLGRGSTFAFELPLRATTRPWTTEGDGLPADATSLEILVVDDNAVNCRVAELLLERMGHRPRSVGDGRRAIEAWQSQRWDAILMDVYMPELDGLEATRRIRDTEVREGREPTAIAAITASALPTEREACEAAGMDAFLVKPLDRAELQAFLQSR